MCLFCEDVTAASSSELHICYAFLTAFNQRYTNALIGLDKIDKLYKILKLRFKMVFFIL